MFLEFKEMRLYKFIILAIVFITVFSCEKKENVIETKVLCHRGSGIGFSYINGDTIYENTLEAVKYGFAHYDGVEIDIQKSKSGTLWVFHNSDLFHADSSTAICVPSSTDEQIRNLNLELPHFQKLCTLEEVLAYRSILKESKYISLDIKGYFEVNCIEGRNVSKEYQMATAQEIVRLIEKFNLQNFVLVETDYLDVLTKVKELNSDISCFVLGYNSFDKRFEKAEEINVNGLSFNFRDSSLTAEAINKLHSEDMKIQVWTITSEKELIKAKALKVDFIQTDN